MGKSKRIFHDIREKLNYEDLEESGNFDGIRDAYYEYIYQQAQEIINNIRHHHKEGKLILSAMKFILNKKDETKEKLP